MTQRTLKEQTAKGLLWGGLSNGAMQLLGALFGLALMRLLSPEDWGKVAVLGIFAALASTLQEGGFIAALCNKKDATDRDYNSVFWLNLMVGASLYTVLWLAAPLIAQFYGDPDLTVLARFLFLGFVLSGLGVVQRAYLFGHLMVRETGICNVSAVVLSNTLGVVLAYLGYAHWAIVSQQLTYILWVQVLSWHFSPWRPSLNIDLRPAWQLFGFSSKLLLTNAFRHLYDHAFNVLLGKWFGQGMAGIYFTARKWNDMAANTVGGMVTSVAQPTLSQVTDDHGRYVQVFRKMMRFVSFICFPTMLGLGIVAQEFILLVGGEKWAQSGKVLALLCVYGAFVPITTLYSNLTISRGHSGVNMACTVGQCLAVWGGLLLLYHMGHGLVPMVLFFIVLNIMWLAVWQWWAKRLVGLRWRWAMMDVLPFLLFAMAVMALTWWATRPLQNLWLLMTARILLAATIYGGIMWLSGAKIMRESIEFLMGMRNRQLGNKQ